MSQPNSLRELSGLGQQPGKLRDSALIMIDLQNTYRHGVMQLEGVEQAVREAAQLLAMARDLKVPVIHIRHDSGPGTPYDVSAEIGQISSEVAPIAGEAVITKHYPNAFVQTDLEAQLRALGITNLTLAGFMTHMCINSTAHGGFNLGFAPTIVASATATRALVGANGLVVSAQDVHNGALAATRDLYAAVADDIAQVA